MQVTAPAEDLKLVLGARPGLNERSFRPRVDLPTPVPGAPKLISPPVANEAGPLPRRRGTTLVEIARAQGAVHLRTRERGPAVPGGTGWLPSPLRSLPGARQVRSRVALRAGTPRRRGVKIELATAHGAGAGGIAGSVPHLSPAARQAEDMTDHAAVEGAIPGGKDHHTRDGGGDAKVGEPGPRPRVFGPSWPGVRTQQVPASFDGKQVPEDA